MAEVKLIFHSGFLTYTYKVYCNSVQVGWRNNNTAKPRVNGGAVVDVLTHGFENPTYTLRGVTLTKMKTSTGLLTYEDLLLMSKSTNTTVSYIELSANHALNYSDATAVLLDSAGNDAGIRVVIDSFNFTMDMNALCNSGNKDYILSGDIILRETA
jgi:hypothetical protein